MKWGLVALALGGAAVIALVAWFGAREIGAEVLRAAWAVPAAILLHAVQLWLSAIAWRGMVGPPGPKITRYLKIRWVREAVNTMLPVAQLGGNLAGIRLLAQRGVTVVRGGAGTVLDLTLEAASQAAFTILGIAALAATRPAALGGVWVWAALGSMLAVLAAFVLAQRAGLLRLLEWAAERMAGMIPKLPQQALAGLHDALLDRQKDAAALWSGVSLHLAAWLLGVLETWLALGLMGQGESLPTALAIESLGMAARSVGFAVPGALGVQEAGFILACGLYGIPPDTAIAVSMVKRVRELVVGVGGLVSWQLTEARQIARER